MAKLETLQRKIDDVRFRGFGGTAIQLHRAIYQIKLNKTNLALSLVLPLMFNYLLLYFLGPILGFWQQLFEFWTIRLGDGALVRVQAIDLGRYTLIHTYPSLPAGAPSGAMWWGTLLACVLLFAASFFFTAKRFLPLSYIVRACVLIQLTALAHFFFLPGQFPYDASTYLGNALTMSLFFLFLIPWILGLTYCVFNFHVLQKMGLIALVLAYFIVALPMQYLAHAVVLQHMSLLYMPLLYLMFGVFIDVMMFVALYAWGMSWGWKSSKH